MPVYAPSLLLRLALIPLILLLGPRVANATIFVVSPAALVGKADAIALGVIRSVTSSWQSGRIVSEVQLEVAGTIKGEVAQTVTLVSAGGQVGDVVMRVIGGADFRVGQRSIVFLTKKDGVHRLLGLAAGKLDVITRDGKELVAWPSADDEPQPLALVVERLRALAAERAR